jgi:hypothetical protein
MILKKYFKWLPYPLYSFPFAWNNLDEVKLLYIEIGQPLKLNLKEIFLRVYMLHKVNKNTSGHVFADFGTSGLAAIIQ